MNATARTAPAQEAHPTASLPEDFENLSEFILGMTEKSQHIVKDFFTNNPEIKMARGELPLDPLNLTDALREVMDSMSSDPGTVMQRQFVLWGDMAKLMAVMSKRFSGMATSPAFAPAPNDKRFRHKGWEEIPALDFIKQAYIMYADWLHTTVDSLQGLTDYEKRRALFYTHQFVDAISPSNIAALNPEVIEATIESKGENLIKGLQNLLDDLHRGHGELAIRQSDLSAFKLGENLATTPGSVVYQNHLMQLIQYAPTTETVAKRPLLIFPPWINKFYILDLQASNSFIKWMVKQGRTVFVVSWVNPDPSLRDTSFPDYIQHGLLEALDAVYEATGEKDVDAIGYCIGGTMLATGLALMADRKDNRVKSATFFTAQADFEEAGDLTIFVDDAQLEAVSKQMDATGGILEGRAMATTFNLLRSNDLIWSFVIDNYLKGKDPAKFDLLYWNNDSTRMTKGAHLYYLREYYQHNRLAEGEMIIEDTRLDLGKVDIPIFMQAGETDHIAPANSIYRTAKLFGGKQVQYMLAGSGHIAGVINHPSKNKYHHSTNPALPDTLEEWQRYAVKHPGSWWPYWMEWLNGLSDEEVPARVPGSGKLKVLEPAPGSYVKVTS